MPNLLLASNSPRRRDLLHLLLDEFLTDAMDIDETPLPNERPQDCARRLATLKVLTAHKRITDHHKEVQWILASDTIVVDGDIILGKPTSAEDARVMLRQLRGKIHKVLTAVALVRATDGDIRVELCSTDVPMRDYTEAEIERYIATGDPQDKAGAYAIQHSEFHPVENLHGCYASVMGLPLCHLSVLLEDSGITINDDVAQRCQLRLDYSCPVYSQILQRSHVSGYYVEKTRDRTTRI